MTRFPTPAWTARLSPRRLCARVPLTQETLGCVLLALYLWLRHVELPFSILDAGLDSSWPGALGYFLATGRQAGTDWCFTAGPLAGLNSVFYQPELFWAKLVLWEGLWRGTTAIVLILASLRIPGRLERCVCILMLVLPGLYFDSYALATLVAAVALLEQPARSRSVLVECLVLLALGGMAWAKFTLFVAVAIMLGALALARGLREGRGAGLRLLAAGGTALAALWFLAGQGLANFWPYLRSSLEIAGAYSEAQSLPPIDESVRTLALACLVLLAALLALSTFVGADARARGATALGLAFAVFCAWKTGFVRANDHAEFFFGFVAPAALLLPAPRPRGWPGATGVVALRLAAVVLGLIGYTRSHSSGRGLAALCDEAAGGPLRCTLVLRSVADLGGLQRSLDAQVAAQRASLGLPRVIERVGNESIDCLGFRPGILLLHGLNWTPRPVFQSYLTFTPWLQQRNADFLSGPQAPRFLLARVESIDNRWAMMDDARALEVACRRYDPLLMERDFLLLERRAEARPEPARERVLERELSFGESLELPEAPADCAQVLTLELEYTLRGRLVRFLEATPELRLELLGDQGQRLGGRMVPATLRSGMQIDPLIVTPRDWADWMVGRELPRCRALAVAGPRGAEWMFEPRFRVRIERLRGLQPPRRGDVEFQDWMDTVFQPRPDAEYSPQTPVLARVEERDVGLVLAPSRYIWTLPPGRYRLAARFGMLPETWEHAGSDGADFRIVAGEGREARTLLKREFRPGQSDLEHRMQAVELDFTLAQQGRLVLATTTGAQSEAVRDFCYWSEVRLLDMSTGAPPKKP